MKIPRVAGLAPALALLCTALPVAAPQGAWAREAQRAPADVSFSQGGQQYKWGVANGVTGALSLGREVDVRTVGADTVKTYATELVVACSGLRSGALQARLYSPQAGAAQLRLTAGPSVFRVYRGVQDVGARPFVDGHGDLPDGFFSALAETPTISVAYGDKVTTFPGPGKALTVFFQNYCRSLAQRASRDE
jgi:hypothetical protein